MSAFLLRWGSSPISILGSLTLLLLFPSTAPVSSVNSPIGTFTIGVAGEPGGSFSFTTFPPTGLPPGLSCDSSGNVTGTPTVTGTYNSTFTVFNSVTGNYGQETITWVVQ